MVSMALRGVHSSQIGLRHVNCAQTHTNTRTHTHTLTHFEVLKVGWCFLGATHVLFILAPVDCHLLLYNDAPFTINVPIWCLMLASCWDAVKMLKRMGNQYAVESVIFVGINIFCAFFFKSHFLRINILGCG